MSDGVERMDRRTYIRASGCRRNPLPFPGFRRLGPNGSSLAGGAVLYFRTIHPSRHRWQLIRA